MDNSDFLEKWAEIRQKGFISYFIKRTILWIIVITIIQLILNYFLDIFSTKEVLSIDFKTLIITTVGIIGKWNYNEKEYKKLMDIN